MAPLAATLGQPLKTSAIPPTSRALGPLSLIANHPLAASHICAGVSSLVMFVVTGLHTKRRPQIGTDKARNRKQGVESLRQAFAIPHPYRYLHPAKLPALPSGQTTLRVSESRMTRYNGDENEDTPISDDSFGWVAPPRIRKFIPKPLILVERMKTRQLLLELTPSVASESCVAPSGIAMAASLSSHVTPPMRSIPSCSAFSSDPSSSVSIRVSSQNGVVFGSGFGMIPRPRRPLSGITLGNSPSSTDTFVADSPCCIKQAYSKIPLLVTETDVEPDSRTKRALQSGVPVIGNRMAADFIHRTHLSIDTFQPTSTSTPFTSNLDMNDVSPPTSFIASALYPIHHREQMPGFSNIFEVASPTSRTVYPFNVPKDGYVVKLPNPESSIPSAAIANAPKPTPDFRRLSNRAASPSPALVLDGVFALPRTLSSSSVPPRFQRTLHGFPRPRKPSSRRPLVDISNFNASVITYPSQPLTKPSRSSTTSHRHPGPESPRSRLAHVLTAHTQRQQTVTRSRRQARVPPLVKGIQASNDPRTQCEIEGLRVRRVVGLGRGGAGSGVGVEGGGGDGDTNEKGAIERMSLASVGMVAKLRARWEAGTLG